MERCVLSRLAIAPDVRALILPVIRKSAIDFLLHVQDVLMEELNCIPLPAFQKHFERLLSIAFVDFPRAPSCTFQLRNGNDML